MSPSLRRAVWGIAVGAAAIVALLVVALVAAFGSGYVRNFRLPSEAMAPTLEKEDRFVAWMGGTEGLKRGDIVLVKVGKSFYVERVAALAGDSIEVSSGGVVLNGRAIPQRLLATEQRAGFAGMQTARRLAEQFPGEAAPHEILDLGPSPVDDIPGVKIPEGFVFVLGDNRDLSADSRVHRDSGGLELVSIADVKGRPWFCTGGCEIGR